MTDLIPRLDRALFARGISANAASMAAGHKGIITNWRNKGQDPSVGSVSDVAEAITVDPAWLAYGREPKPVQPPNGFHANPMNLDPDTYLGVAYAAWKADDGQLENRFFDALEMLGLLDAIYILKRVDNDLVYERIGPLFRKTLGFSWWVTAPGQRITDDPDQAFASWCLAHYQEAMHREEPAAHECLVVSRYTGISKGWPYRRLILPFEDLLIVVVEVM